MITFRILNVLKCHAFKRHKVNEFANIFLLYTVNCYEKTHTSDLMHVFICEVVQHLVELFDNVLDSLAVIATLEPEKMFEKLFCLV